jgi:pyruvate/2-oxoglutarate dehydrogenase complex dihydrolipoamide dehydrogenase (E3) component
MRTLAVSDDPRSKEAIDLFVYRASREIGSLAAALGGLDTLVFTAGIGENSPLIRERICKAAAWLGVEIDSESNLRNEECISISGSAVDVLVIPTDEERAVAEQVLSIVPTMDDGGNWKGCGTAWKLAEDGYEVTLVTPDALVGKELQRMAADVPLRRTLARLGVRFLTESAVTHWNGATARVVSLLDGRENGIEADTLIYAATNFAEDTLAVELDARGIPFTAIGDCTASRQAAYAIHDGRKAALSL